jgi:hypothetical protein
MVPVTMMLVSVAIIVTMPVTTIPVVGWVVVGRVVTRCRINDGHTGKRDTDADIGMRFGGNAVRNAGDP